MPNRLSTITASRPSHVFLILSLALLVYSTYSFIAFSYNYMDAWEHSAAIKSLIDNPAHPSNPHIRSEAPSPRFMPLYVLAGFIGHWAGASPFDVYKGIETSFLIILLLGIYAFSSSYFRSPVAPPVLLLVILGAWGTGIVWSNALDLRSLLIVAGYPSTAATGLTFLLWYEIIRIVRSPPESSHAAGLVIIALLTALTLLTHVLTGAVALGGAALLLLTEKPSDRYRHLLPVSLSMLLGMLLVELWPYYSTLKIFTGTQHNLDFYSTRNNIPRWKSLTGSHPFYNPKSILISLGVAIISFPISLYYIRRRRHLFPAIALWGLFSIYLLNLFVDIPLGHRALLFSILFGQILLTAYILHGLRKQRSTGWVITTSLLAFSILLNLGMAGRETIILHDKFPRLAATYTELTKTLRPDDVVMSTPQIGWPLPTFAGKIVSPAHPNPFIEDSATREEDTRAFFSPDTPDERRWFILKRYDVGFLLLDLTQAISRDLQSRFCGKKRIRSSSLLICEIDRSIQDHKYAAD